ncbi:MAG: TetR/AcrR family transcriptional regulator [Solirubrobacterales bacterium]|nr:TetR/AcrR family transcriptional regulator [Solirubrobacterales bacterium]
MTSPTHAQPSADLLEAIESELAIYPHRRVPRDLRRRHLLELATRLFSERGFDAASMDELAQRAGVSKPVIYDQFGSKEGLLLAAIDALGSELNAAVIQAVEGRTDPEDLLRAGSLAFFRFVGEQRATWSMAFGAVRSLDDTARPAAEKIAEIRARQDGLVTGVIFAAAQELGKEPDQLEVGALTRGLNGLYEGLVEWWESHPDVDPEQLTDWVVALILPGLTAVAEAS